MLPEINLTGSLTVNGLGGNRITRSGLAGNITGSIPGGYSDALDQIWNAEFRDWSAGIEISHSVGKSAADAAHASAKVDYRRRQATIQSLELQITREVRQETRRVETSYNRIQVNQIAQELAQRRLDAEERRFNFGISTDFLVVQAQRDLTKAEVNELRAVIDSNKALVVLERPRGTLLETR